MNARHGMEARLISVYPDSPSQMTPGYHDSILARVLIFSKLSQNVMDQGAILSQQGMKPLYNAITPSVFTLFTRQSRLPEYFRPRPSASRGWFITLALTTSAGVPRLAAARPAHALDRP